MSAFPYLPGLSGALPDELVVVRHDGDEYLLDIPALLSNYRCIYGHGCQGTTPLTGERPGLHRPADLAVAGCCRTSPIYRTSRAAAMTDASAHPDSPLRTQPFVDAMRPDEAQHYTQIAAGRWLSEAQDEDGNWAARHDTVGGNCIFLNTEMPNGKTGCALHHVATRLGADPHAARPDVCHVEPAAAFLVADDLEGGGERILVTLRPKWFGWFSPDGYFCTTDPAAFSSAEPVFRAMKSEYSILLGDPVYAALIPALEQAWQERGGRMRAKWGNPVQLATPTWAR